MTQPDFVSPMLMQQQSSLYATPQEMSNVSTPTSSNPHPGVGIVYELKYRHSTR